MAVALCVALECYSSAAPQSDTTPKSTLAVRSGSVEVNGVAVVKPLQIKDGDIVKVLANSSATITHGMEGQPKTRVTLNPNTNLQWKSGSELLLHDGNIIVDSRDFTTYLESCGQVRPFDRTTAGPNTRYEVQIQGNRAFVYARELSARVENNGKKLDVQPMRVAAVESIRATKCRVAYVDAPDSMMLTGGVGAAYAAAGVVLLNLDKSSVSADCPIDPCRNRP
jgi:hypothetical protein